MKIALVSPYDFAYPGGVQSHITALGKELVSRGHEVKVLSPCTRNEPAYDMDGLELIQFGRSVPLPTAGSIARISFSVWHEPRLRSTLRDGKFDIVHIHEPLMPMFALMCCFLSQSPTVGTFHAYNEGRGKGYIFWKQILKRGAERLDGRIAVSEPASQFANKYFPGDYAVIPNGLDVERFSRPAPKPSVYRDDSINLLFVGRVNESRKGLRYLLGAYSLLKWDYPKLRLIIAGPGVPHRDAYQVMSERDIDDVVFVGPVKSEELPAYYQHADIFCAPNTGKESFGMVLAEAMASSTPIVATDILGFRNVVRDGNQALLVPPSDEAALAEGIRKLIENPGLRTGMGMNGRAWVNQYAWRNVATNVLDYYGSLIERTGKGAIAAGS